MLTIELALELAQKGCDRGEKKARKYWGAYIIDASTGVLLFIEAVAMKLNIGRPS